MAMRMKGVDWQRAMLVELSDAFHSWTAAMREEMSGSTLKR
jgi:hypothetical protein